MKTLTKSLAVASIIGAIGLGGLASVSVASAESSSGTTDPMSNLVDKISSTFNLDKTKVKQVFDSHRSEMEAEHDKRVSERLQALVDNKTITSTQKSAIETKLAELKKEREANKETFKDMTNEERKAKMEELRTELEDWAESQGLDLGELKGILGGPGGHGGPGGRH